VASRLPDHEPRAVVQRARARPAVDLPPAPRAGLAGVGAVQFLWDGRTRMEVADAA
jgi:hypothetical protein